MNKNLWGYARALGGAVRERFSSPSADNCFPVRYDRLVEFVENTPSESSFYRVWNERPGADGRGGLSALLGFTEPVGPVLSPGYIDNMNTAPTSVEAVEDELEKMDEEMVQTPFFDVKLFYGDRLGLKARLNTTEEWYEGEEAGYILRGDIGALPEEDDERREKMIESVETALRKGDMSALDSF